MSTGAAIRALRGKAPAVEPVRASVTHNTRDHANSVESRGGERADGLESVGVVPDPLPIAGGAENARRETSPGTMAAPGLPREGT